MLERTIHRFIPKNRSTGSFVHRVITTSCVLFLWSHPTAAETTSACFSMKDGVARQECYEAVAQQRNREGSEKTTAAEIAAADLAASGATSRWEVMNSTSPLDDSPVSIAAVFSDNMLPPIYGHSEQARIAIRCAENKTSVFIDFGEHFMASIQGYGRVSARVDDRKAVRLNTTESTDHHALGLWSGAKAIPFVKGMFGGQSLYVEATPFNEAPLSLTFHITGVEDAVGQIRKDCGW